MNNSFLMNQPAWRVSLLCLIGAASLTAGVYIALVRPVQATRRQNAVIAEQVAQKTLQANDLRALLETATTRHDALLAELNRQRIDLGDASQLNRRIASLIQLAQEHGLDVVQLQPGDRQTAEHYNLLTMKLEAVASPAQHAEFLARLHARFPDMSVTALTLDKPRRDHDAQARAVLQIVWFTAKADAPALPAPSAGAVAAAAVGP